MCLYIGVIVSSERSCPRSKAINWIRYLRSAPTKAGRAFPTRTTGRRRRRQPQTKDRKRLINIYQKRFTLVTPCLDHHAPQQARSVLAQKGRHKLGQLNYLQQIELLLPVRPDTGSLLVTVRWGSYCQDKVKFALMSLHLGRPARLRFKKTCPVTHQDAVNATWLIKWITLLVRFIPARSCASHRRPR